jgi:galactonate dehydratase
MKITAIKYFMPTLGIRCRFIVKVETDTGIYGLGEAGTAGRERALGGMIDHFREFLIGRDPRRIEDIAQVLYRGQYFEGGTVVAAAASAIDIALWDILGKHLNAPVYQLMGGATREHVDCFIDVRAGDGSTWGEKALDLVEKGWKTIRMTPLPLLPEGDEVYEPWNSLDETAELVHEVRRAVGNRIQLGVDFHHRLSVAEAAEFSRRIEDAGLMFLEEPIRSESPDAYAALRAMTPVPFAIGEEFSGIYVFAPFIERGLANYVRPDVCNVGGITGAKKVAAMAEAHYIDVMPHDPLGPVCTAASVHLCSAIPNFASLEFNTHVQDQPEDLFPATLTLEKNYFPLPDAPGLGVEFNEEAAKDYPFAFWEPPHLRRTDGSFTNW